MRKRGKQGTWLVTAQAKGWIVVRQQELELRKSEVILTR